MVNSSDELIDIDEVDVSSEPPKKQLALEKDFKDKALHNIAEKKRREAIKTGFKNLTDALHLSSEQRKKLSRTEILEIATQNIKYSGRLLEEKSSEKANLESQYQALKLIAKTYENMPKTSEKTSIPPDLNCVVSNHIKLKLFTTLFLNQFESFRSVVSTGNVQSFTSSLFYWLEVYWRPVDLKEYLIGLLKVLRNRFVDKKIPEKIPELIRA